MKLAVAQRVAAMTTSGASLCSWPGASPVSPHGIFTSSSQAGISGPGRRSHVPGLPARWQRSACSVEGDACGPRLKGHQLFLPHHWSQRAWGGCILSHDPYHKPVSGCLYLHPPTPPYPPFQLRKPRLRAAEFQGAGWAVNLGSSGPSPSEPAVPTASP